jgi:hypothetical protein
MTGIQFLTDDKGHRVAVQIDLKKHGGDLARLLGRIDLRVAPYGKGYSLRSVPR